MKITKKDISHVAHLARLELSEEEMERFTAQVGEILDYMDALGRVDTSDVEPAAHVLDIVNVFRPDVLQESMDPELGLANAPEKDGTEFIVPRVI